MQSPPGFPSPAEHELRLRATMRVRRRRSFMVSAVVVGSLIVLNFFLYARTHNSVWLLLDGVFAFTLSFRAWAAFGADKKDDERIRREMARMQQMQQMMPSQGMGNVPPNGWARPTTPQPPAVPPPPAAAAPQWAAPVPSASPQESRAG